MLLLFSYVSYLISPNSNSFLQNYPILSFIFYPLFLFFILKHILYLCCQIKINAPYPAQKYIMLTCVLNENIDLITLKANIDNKIQKEDRFKILKRAIKNNLFISYSCPVNKFSIDNHFQIIDAPFERDMSLYQFLELNLMGLFETNENDPQWRIFVIKNFQNTPILIFKYLAEYSFSQNLILKLLADKNFKIKSSIRLREDVEWSLSKNLRVMKRIMDIKTKNQEDPNIYMFLRRLIKGDKKEIIRKQIAFADTSLSKILENGAYIRDDHGFLNEKEVDFMFDLFKLAGLFIPHALMMKAYGALEDKYQRMGYLNRVEFENELPGVIRRMYMINWKEQLFSISLSEQSYKNQDSVVLIQNENLKKK